VVTIPKEARLQAGKEVERDRGARRLTPHSALRFRARLPQRTRLPAGFRPSRVFEDRGENRMLVALQYVNLVL
jgi:hypothetical protein